MPTNHLTICIGSPPSPLTMLIKWIHQVHLHRWGKEASPLFLTSCVPKAKPNTVFIKESLTGGLGMFTGHDIKYGELLFAKHPLHVCPANASMHGVLNKELVDKYTYDDFIKILCFEWEQQLEFAVSHMDLYSREAYLVLANLQFHIRKMEVNQNCFGYSTTIQHTIWAEYPEQGPQSICGFYSWRSVIWVIPNLVHCLAYLQI